MSLTPTLSSHFVWILVAALCGACTGGVVTKNGSPVPTAEVFVYTCDSDPSKWPGDFLAMTNTFSDGQFAFNPFSPASPTFDESKYIPEGPVRFDILAQGDAGFSVLRRNHEYSTSCNVPVNGSIESVPCKLHFLSLETQTATEAVDVMETFYKQDCGLSADKAKLLSTAIIADRGSARPMSERRQASCLRRCAYSCIQNNVPVAEYAPCMCECAGSSCGTSFGPFCKKAVQSRYPQTVPPNKAPAAAE